MQQGGLAMRVHHFAYVTFLYSSKERVPPRKAPRVSRPACRSGFPRRAHDRGNGTNSHIRALRQRAVRIRAHAPVSAAKRWG